MLYSKPMKLAVNYSPQAAELLQEAKIAFDLFKCPDWDGMIAEAQALKPLYVHFPLITGKLGEVDLERVERLLEQTQTPFVNVHLVATPKDLDLPITTQEAAHVEQITDWLISEVSTLVKRFGAERVIAENVIYRGFGLDMLRPTVLPNVIRNVVETTGCGLLLDLSHARIAAHYLSVDAPGVELWDYLNGLPLARLKELHVTGVHFHSERLRDHLGFNPPDWQVAEKAFKFIHEGRWATPHTVALEYGGSGEGFAWRSEKAVLARDVPRLHALVKG